MDTISPTATTLAAATLRTANEDGTRVKDRGSAPAFISAITTPTTESNIVPVSIKEMDKELGKDAKHEWNLLAMMEKMNGASFETRLNMFRGVREEILSTLFKQHERLQKFATWTVQLNALKSADDSHIESCKNHIKTMREQFNKNGRRVTPTLVEIAGKLSGKRRDRISSSSSVGATVSNVSSWIPFRRAVPQKLAPPIETDEDVREQFLDTINSGIDNLTSARDIAFRTMCSSVKTLLQLITVKRADDSDLPDIITCVASALDNDIYIGSLDTLVRDAQEFYSSVTADAVVAAVTYVRV